MNDSDRDRIVRDYITRAMEIQNGKNDDLPDLEEIARELGMTDREIAGVERAAREHFERGSGYLRHGEWDDAIGELTVATALDPASIDALYALAAAHAGRWGATRHKEDRAEAERLIKRCIDLKPDHEKSFTLLSRLHGGGAKTASPDVEAAMAAAAASARTGKRAGVIIASVAMAVLAVAGGAVAFFASSGSSSDSRFSASKGIPIPVKLADGSGMRLDLDDARIYPGDSLCCVKGDVTPTDGAAGLATVALELDLIDAGGNVAARDQFTAWPCDKHPGAFNFHRDNPMLPGIKEARLVVRQ